MAALEPGWAGPAGGSLRPGATVRGRPGREELLAAEAAPLRAPLRGSGRKRHRMDAAAAAAAPGFCPPRKKRLAEAAPAARPWGLCTAPPAGGRGGGGGGVEPGEAPWEDMTEPMTTGGEQPCEAARRKLQEIEDRIAEEDEEEDGLVEGTATNLPTLVLSDTLKTGLKRDYSGDLTKKIIESMSRPSMELVLWKPLPEFLTQKAKSVSTKNYKPTAAKCPAKSAALEAAFCLQTGKFSRLQEPEMSSDFYSDVEPTGCTEEEMEL